RLEEMWWPEVEFVNTSSPEITNRAVVIRPDGSVELMFGMTGLFHVDLDLRNFPFDRQVLEVRIESFLWEEHEMVFEIDRERIGFTPESTFEGLIVTHVDAITRSSMLEGWNSRYSQFVARLFVERQANFYVWTVFAPVTLIFLISCTVFAIPIENFHDRVGISLAAILACIATQ